MIKNIPESNGSKAQQKGAPSLQGLGVNVSDF